MRRAESRGERRARQERGARVASASVGASAAAQHPACASSASAASAAPPAHKVLTAAAARNQRVRLRLHIADHNGVTPSALQISEPMPCLVVVGRAGSGYPKASCRVGVMSLCMASSGCVTPNQQGLLLIFLTKMHFNPHRSKPGRVVQW